MVLHRPVELAALTGEVGPGTQLTGKATNRDLGVRLTILKSIPAEQRSALAGAQRLGVLAAATGGAKLWPARE
jgi:hypothetical protein